MSCRRKKRGAGGVGDTDTDIDDDRYAMIGICPVLYVGWKVLNKTKIYSAEEVDLVKNVAEIDEYQRTFVPSPPR